VIDTKVELLHHVMIQISTLITPSTEVVVVVMSECESLEHLTLTKTNINLNTSQILQEITIQVVVETKDNTMITAKIHRATTKITTMMTLTMDKSITTTIVITISIIATNQDIKKLSIVSTPRFK